MIDCLVFSKDRAAQLDLLLRSIQRHAPNLYSSLAVLYTGSSADYLRGYQQCFVEHPEAKFVLEHNFETQVRYWLSVYTYRPISFLVDDDVFYRDVPDGDEQPGPPCSLRGGDYDYPFSVDGNIYEWRHVVDLLRDLRFRDPTELEANAHNVRERLPFDRVAPVLPPCLVGVPANRVSVSSGMPHMGVQTRMLNERYLAGDRLRIEGEPWFDLPAHEALDYGWIPAEVAV